jgi:hypothetical protein
LFFFMQQLPLVFRILQTGLTAHLFRKSKVILVLGGCGQRWRLVLRVFGTQQTQHAKRPPVSGSKVGREF